jgi:hypothetical protein
MAGKTRVSVKTKKLRGKANVRGGVGTATRTVGLLGGILTFALPNRFPIREENQMSHGPVGDRSILVTVDDRVRDGPLGNNSHDIVRARTGGAVKDNGGTGAMALQPGKHEA